MPWLCGLGTRKDWRVVGAPRHLNRPFLEKFIYPVIDGLPAFQRDTELPYVNRVVVGEVDFMLDDVCPSEIEFPLTDNVMVPVEHFPVCRRPGVRRLDIDRLVQEGQLFLGGLPDGPPGWFLGPVSYTHLTLPTIYSV